MSPVLAKIMLVLLNIVSCFLLLPRQIVSCPQNSEIIMHTRRNYHLQGVYRSYPACIIHIVDLIGKLELAQPTLPIILDVRPEEVESLRNLSSHITEFKKAFKP